MFKLARVTLSLQHHLLNYNKTQLLKLLSAKYSNKLSNKAFEKHTYADVIVKEVSKLGIDPERIIRALKNQPKLLNIDSETIKSSLDALCLHGFSDKCVLRMITKCPELAKLSSEDIDNVLSMWRENEYKGTYVTLLLSENPELFALDRRELRERTSNLTHYMDGRLGRVTKLLMECPEVMFLNWPELESKFIYFIKDMRVGIKQIYKCRALTYPLFHIKTRHKFLELAGVYKKKTEDDDNTGFNPHTNPDLKDIVCTEDDVFAINVAKVSPEEYDVFKKIMARNFKKEDLDLMDDIESII